MQNAHLKTAKIRLAIRLKSGQNIQKGYALWGLIYRWFLSNHSLQLPLRLLNDLILYCIHLFIRKSPFK